MSSFVTFNGEPIRLGGDFPRVGDTAPSFKRDALTLFSIGRNKRFIMKFEANTVTTDISHHMVTFFCNKFVNYLPSN